MQIHIPDPAYTSSEQARANFRLAIALRRLDIPPRKRYAWEDEKDECEDDQFS
jgi:hypothetical protein